MPRHYGRTGGRRRPLDQILNPELPTSPVTTDSGTVTGPGTITGPVTPIDEVLGDGDGDGGDENPWVNPFMEVYEKTKAGALTNLADIQKQMSESFAHRGGYFGGKHAVSQGEVAARTGSYLDQLLAETELGATQMQYEDWKRGRSETMNLMNLIPLLLGSETFQNIIQMPGPGVGESIGDILGSFAGGVGGAVGKG